MTEENHLSVTQTTLQEEPVWTPHPTVEDFPQVRVPTFTDGINTAPEGQCGSARTEQTAFKLQSRQKTVSAADGILHVEVPNYYN